MRNVAVTCALALFLGLNARPTVAQPAPISSTSKQKAASEQKATPEQEAETEQKVTPEREATPEQEAETERKAKEQKEKQERLQKIQKLTFDRRPSAILRAWSTPVEETPVEETPVEETAVEETAVEETAGEKAATVSGTSSTASRSGSLSPVVAPQDPLTLATAGAAGPDGSSSSVTGNDPFSKSLRNLQRDVTLGKWDDVRGFLKSLAADEGKAAYAKLLEGMVRTPSGLPPGVETMPGLSDQQRQRITSLLNQSRGRGVETNVISFTDVLGIAAAAPQQIDQAALSSLASIVRIAIGAGHVVERFVVILEEETGKHEDERVFTRRQAARLLFNAGYVNEGGEFLPEIDTAKTDNDLEALNMLSRVYVTKYNKEKKTPLLESAWELTQIVFNAHSAKAGDDKDDAESKAQRKKEREIALRQAVELAPKVRNELGAQWLNESFTKNPARGMEIIATIGGTAARAMQQHGSNPDARLKNLKLQTTAVEALISSAPERAKEWQSSLSLLAANWLREGLLSQRLDESDSYGSSMRRDRYGNYFYYSSDMGSMYGSSSQRRGQAIKTGDVLEIRPSSTWLSYVDEGLTPKFDMLFAQLFLKVQEDDEAFPYIEKLAQTHPRQAETLVDEFLQLWTRNHDPNGQRNRTNYYMFSYGYNRRAEGIPLTRSKQERNLVELSELIQRLNALPLERINEQLLAKAFTTCHSSAEVYELESIEKVFGPIKDLTPKTLAELAQQMRANLAGIWRSPAEQEKKKTRRKKQDIQEEVFRGYDVAKTVVSNALKKHTKSWSLMLALASIEHDENNYRQDIANDSGFSSRKKQALGRFQQAADLYAEAAKDLDVQEQTTKVHELWFYASLGAVDLGQVKKERVPDLREPTKIRKALLELGGELGEHHMGMFANSLFTRMSNANPGVKYGYLKGGFEIVGDHKQAHEARKVYEYYNNLVDEIKLEAVVDGSAAVGSEEPFGVYYNIRHTREIERESGGFGRYLQNQNNTTGWSYNYGRPTENYRDKFEEIVREACGEQFEVLSVTFQSEDVNSRAVKEYGWRITPYAYVLMKARGPEVDKIPSVRLDLDFLDTSGYAVLPIESAVVPIDAGETTDEPRPFRDLRITQTLDERQADEGKLILEIKATAQGIVPDLEEVLEVKSAGFDVVETEDQGVSISRFDPESKENVVVSERLWMLTFSAEEGLRELPEAFAFATPQTEMAEMLFQRFDDADLAAVEATILLQQEYGEVDHSAVWIWSGIGMLALAIAVVAVLVFRKRPADVTSDSRFAMPGQVTPFTIIGLLKQIERNNGLSPEGLSELTESINRIERYYFFENDGAEPNLEHIAADWILKAR